MSTGTAPETPRFDAELEGALRSLAAPPVRAGARRRGAIALAVAVAVVVALVAFGAWSGRRPASEVTGDAGTAAATGVVVPGRPGGAAPCAAPGAGAYGANPAHPERAPRQATATFPGGVRWALCGADPSYSGDVLNLRSGDGGATWSVTATPIAINLLHAGDTLDVRFADASRAEVHVVSAVADRDDRYVTADGGRTWRLAR
ncbi:MAG TPA: hypothetical protein VKB57_14400 [Acidimicrobiales bacterium]|nr:hypothetical protein [Acidimicrobiales bacterium]